MNIKKIYISVLSLAFLIAIVYFYYHPLQEFWHTFSNEEKLKDFILNYGPFSAIVFFVIQFIQVIFSPIPGNVTTLIGGHLFGIAKGSLISVSAITGGSFVGFLLARFFGQPLVIKLVGKEVFDKYSFIIKRKGIIVLFLIFLFPFFPDDALCLLAGLSPISIQIFLILLVLGRWPSIILGTVVGAGVIELSYMTWIFIVIASFVLIYFSYKYGEKLEDWLLDKINGRQKAP